MGVLDGKAVVVTGAGRGLGRASALHAAAHGAAVVVNDVDGEPADEVVSLIEDSGGRAVTSVGSVADPDQAHAAVERCLAAFGRIDGLVNNAGVRYQAPVWEDTPDRMRALIEVNVLGALYCGSAAARAMRDRGTGSIVNMASLATVGQPTAATYSASKGAVSSTTVAWAWELGEHGVRVNGLFPLAHTRMALTDTKSAAPADETPERIAPIVTYLLSDLSSAVTGQLIRFTANKIHIVRQLSAKDPVLRNDGWDVEDIAEVFDDQLLAVLDRPTRATVDPPPRDEG
ncbi:SDR family NAD(P)-dependent oxidoreductase [Actinophytocola gossypii]|uniref:SDR family NAD(P)-dependent oxidoreductase n=1 Tax=Actinophytocola gossypii TaxID=2812003 RepID=A0ABT2JHZ4_9PSEU|nr:SDR family NAD(P)-dependent oxidoreductase [Actinophytocola gossypii]MCT2587373.1 SDR family NAD(P)-dependent oxidoreductase [Actinophytocola gossypii]